MKATMKLSEAILLGSVGSEQGFGAQYMADGRGALCAMASALKAQGLLTDDSVNNYDRVYEAWPWVSVNIPAPCLMPIGSRQVDQVVSWIWRLNDIMKWTRPQIAAWVAELEKIYDPDPVPVQVSEHETVTETIHQ